MGTLEQVFTICRALGQCSLLDFQQLLSEETAGLHCFHTSHITGIRGQAAQGFPLVTDVGLPMLRHWTDQGLSLNDAGAITLLALLSQAVDTNMIHRGGLVQAEQCRHQAAELLTQVTSKNAQALLTQLDQEYIQKNLSPGGCADLLALSYMLFFLEHSQVF